MQVIVEGCATVWDHDRQIACEGHAVSCGAKLVIDYVRKTKGWEPSEYRLELGIALADAPLEQFTLQIVA